MPDSRVNLQPACVIHRRPYRETSQLIDAFSMDYGRQSLVARGIRKARSRWSGLLEPFQPVLLSWSGRGELVTLTGVELETTLKTPAGAALRAGFYLNELVLRLLPKGEPHSDLFQVYWGALEALSQGQREEVVLRTFERDLLIAIGYGLVTDHDVDTGDSIEPSRDYYYAPQSGPSRLATAGCRVSGQTLSAIASGTFTDETQLSEAKTLMRSILRLHLGSRPLGSRLLYADTL